MFRRNAGSLTAEEREILAELLVLEGLPEADLPEVLNILDETVDEVADAYFIIGLVGEIVETYTGVAPTKGALVTETPAAALFVLPPAPVLDPSQTPLWAIRQTAVAMQELRHTLANMPPAVTKTWELVKNVTQPDKFKLYSSEWVQNPSKYQEALAEAHKDIPVLYYALMRSLAKALLNPDFGGVGSIRPEQYPRRKSAWESLPAIIAALSTPAVPTGAYNAAWDPRPWPRGDADLATKGALGEEGDTWEISRNGRISISPKGMSRSDLIQALATEGYRAKDQRGKVQIPPNAVDATLEILGVRSDLLRWLTQALFPVKRAIQSDPRLIALSEALTPEDNAFIDEYYKHFRETLIEQRHSVETPTDPETRAAVLPILRNTVTNLEDIQYFPSIVTQAPIYLGAVTARVPLDRSKAVSYGFRMRGAQTKVTIWLANPWTTGLLEGFKPIWLAWKYAAPREWSETYNVYRRFSKAAGDGLSAKNTKQRPKPADQWLIDASLLSPEGIEWAKGATEFDPNTMNVSDYTGTTGQVALAIASFVLDLNDLKEVDIQRLAAKLEKAYKPLIPLAAALRIAYGEQMMVRPRNPDLPFLARAPRVHDKKVTGRDGTTLNVVGLARRDVEYQVLEPATRDVKERADKLHPPESFKVTVKVPGRTLDDPPTTEVWRPFDYQRVGIAFALMNDGKAIIGDEMGLGKTIQALGFLAVNPNPLNDRPSLPALVVCPGSVETNWVKECKRWLPHLKAMRYESNKTKLNTPHDVMVTSWDMITLYPEFFQAQKYQTVIADEMHYAKRLYSMGASKKKFGMSIASLMGRDTSPGFVRRSWAPYVGRTAALMMLTKEIPNRILMTGTPFSNANPTEIWPALNMLDPQGFPDLKAFIKDYMPKTENQVSAALAKIADMTQPYMVRRIKQGVADQTLIGDLVIPTEGRARFGPTKSLQTDTLNLTPEQDDYIEAYKEGMTELIRTAQWDQRMERAVTAVLNGEDPHTVVMRINQLELDPEKVKEVGIAMATYERQFVGELKVPNAAQWIKRKVEIERKPVVVWVYHKNVAKAMETILKDLKIKGKPARYALITGSVNNTAKAKGKIVDLFQNGELDAVVGSPSMAEGVTLTRANEALFVEYWWVPGKLIQAQDRIFRVGQKEDCIITTLHAPGTIDDSMEEGLQRKDAILDQIAGMDQYSRDDIETRLDATHRWMTEIVLKRLKQRIAEATLLPDEITVEDLKDALSDNPKNIVEVYKLTNYYSDPSIFGFPTRLLLSADAALERIQKAKGIGLTATTSAIIQALADAPDAAKGLPRLTLITEVTREVPAAKMNAIDKAITKLAALGIVTPYDAPPGIPVGSNRIKLVKGFQEAGGALAREEMKTTLGKVPPKDILTALVAEGILAITRRPRVRTNPRRPGQMAVNGRLPDLPFNALDALAFGDYWGPDAKRAVQAGVKQRKAALSYARKRINAALRSPRAKLPSLTYAAYALQHYIKMPKRALYPALADAFAAYNRLHGTVALYRKARQPVPQKVLSLLKRAHAVLSPYED